MAWEQQRPRWRCVVALWAMLAPVGCTIELDRVRCLVDSDCENIEELCIAGTCRTTDEPYIRIVSPESGVLNSNSAVIQVRIGNFTIDPEAIGGAPAPGRGHWHVFLNGDYYDFSVATEFAMTRLPLGVNRLRVALAANNHADLPYDDEVDVDVRTESRSLLIVQPDLTRVQRLEVAADGIIPMQVQTEHFDFAPEADVGGEAHPCQCEGHMHLYVTLLGQPESRTYQGPRAFPSFDVDTGALFVSDGRGGEGPLAIGESYELELRLAENDHRELDPPVFDFIRFEVVEPSGEGTGEGTQ